MFAIQLAVDPDVPGNLVVPVLARPDGAGATLPSLAWRAPDAVRAEADALLATADDAGKAGTTHHLPRPLSTPSRVLLVGVGPGDEAGWRAAGAAVARAWSRETRLTVAMPADLAPEAVRGIAEGLWLGAYRFRVADDQGSASRIEEVVLAVDDATRHEQALAAARAVASATRFARDLTNTPSSIKSPAWFADQVRAAAATRPGLSVTIRDRAWLAAEGFGGVLAVGGGSAREPLLLELRWRPEDSDDTAPHVVLVGKGITFDTGGVSIKPTDAMKLMRKDMGGAAAIMGATIGAADLRLPVRVTALAPLAENMLSGSAFRPGDVIHHYGGMTSETTNSDAEGRLVLADALAYAVAQLAPDLLVDLATLTGANAVALGKRTAALYSEDDDLAHALLAAATAAGEHAWRMPLVADYVEYLRSDVADFYSAPDKGAGSVTAALYLREFTGELRQRWAHIDMSAPSWSDQDDAELSKGATGWGVRTLLRWLPTLGASGRPAGERA